MSWKDKSAACSPVLLASSFQLSSFRFSAISAIIPTFTSSTLSSREARMRRAIQSEAQNAGVSVAAAATEDVSALVEDGDDVEAGDVEAGEVEAGEVEAGEVEAGEVEAGEGEAGEGEGEARDVEVVTDDMDAAGDVGGARAKDSMDGWAKDSEDALRDTVDCATACFIFCIVVFHRAVFFSFSCTMMGSCLSSGCNDGDGDDRVEDARLEGMEAAAVVVKLVGRMRADGFIGTKEGCVCGIGDGGCGGCGSSRSSCCYRCAQRGMSDMWIPLDVVVQLLVHQFHLGRDALQILDVQSVEKLQERHKQALFLPNDGDFEAKTVDKVVDVETHVLFLLVVAQLQFLLLDQFIHPLQHPQNVVVQAQQVFHAIHAVRFQVAIHFHFTLQFVFENHRTAHGSGGGGGYMMVVVVVVVRRGCGMCGHEGFARLPHPLPQFVILAVHAVVDGHEHPPHVLELQVDQFALEMKRVQAKHQRIVGTLPNVLPVTLLQLHRLRLQQFEQVCHTVSNRHQWLERLFQQR